MVRFTFSLNLKNRAAPKLYKHIIQVFFFFSHHLSLGLKKLQSIMFLCWHEQIDDFNEYVC